MITASIVSHGHGEMVNQLIQQLLVCPEIEQIILTRNIPEQVAPPLHAKLELIENSTPAGFGANHNAAFLRCTQPFFCVINPDISLSDDPFPDLLAVFTAHGVALSAPLVINPEGGVEDSIRHFPTPCSLLAKALMRTDGRYQITPEQEPFCPEWVAGMFMLFDSAKFRVIGGFDTVFFLYYEDVDICTRFWKSRHKIVVCPSTQVIHAARRESHRNWRFLRWHITSMLRYFCKHLGRLPNTQAVSSCTS